MNLFPTNPANVLMATEAPVLAHVLPLPHLPALFAAKAGLP